MTNTPFKRKLGNVIVVEGHGEVKVPYGLTINNRYSCIMLGYKRYPDLSKEDRFYYWNDYSKLIDCLYDAIGMAESEIERIKIEKGVDLNQFKRKTVRELYGVELLVGVTYHEIYGHYRVKSFKVAMRNQGRRTLHIPIVHHDDIEYIKEMAIKANRLRQREIDQSDYINMGRSVGSANNIKLDSSDNKQAEYQRDIILTKPV